MPNPGTCSLTCFLPHSLGTARQRAFLPLLYYLASKLNETKALNHNTSDSDKVVAEMTLMTDENEVLWKQIALLVQLRQRTWKATRPSQPPRNHFVAQTIVLMGVPRLSLVKNASCRERKEYTLSYSPAFVTVPLRDLLFD